MNSFKKPSYFINFEGIDCSGKSTLINDIKKEFSKTIPVFVTKELTTDIGSIILKKLKLHTMEPYEKVLLFAADRQQRYSKEMKEKLKTRCLFLSDRWFFSAIVYRCAEDPSIRGYVIHTNSIFIKPDITFYIDITASESIRRGASSHRTYYSEPLLDKAREGYLSLVEKYNFIKIDGMRDYNSVREEVFRLVNKIITENLKIP
ncbi:dTMP kinase [candidate division WOR-3 bacterium]|nr:dTMP kinase [candidate division WOR-3 bacterium]